MAVPNVWVENGRIKNSCTGTRCRQSKSANACCGLQSFVVEKILEVDVEVIVVIWLIVVPIFILNWLWQQW